MGRTAWVWLLGGLALGGTVAAQTSSVDDLGWLAGCWSESSERGTVEECWMAPRGGMMIGVNRTTRTGGQTSFEVLRIADSEKGLAYHASPGGQMPPTLFPLVESSQGRVVFANPEHDFPQRILYWLDGETLHARIEGDVDGETRSMEWTWTRANWESRAP